MIKNPCSRTFKSYFSLKLQQQLSDKLKSVTGETWSLKENRDVTNCSTQKKNS